MRCQMKFLWITAFVILTPGEWIEADARSSKPTAGKMIPVSPAEGRYGHWLYLSLIHI